MFIANDPAISFSPCAGAGDGDSGDRVRAHAVDRAFWQFVRRHVAGLPGPLTLLQFPFSEAFGGAEDEFEQG